MRARLVDRLLSRDHRGPRLIDLIDRDKLLGQQWLDAMKVVGGVSKLGLRPIQFRFAAVDVRLRLIDGRCRVVDIGGRTLRVGLRRAYGTLLRCDGPALVDDLAFQRAQIGLGPLQRIFVRTGIDLKQQAALLDELVVLYRQRNDGAIDLGSDADEVGKYLGVIGARIPVGYRSRSAPVISAAATISSSQSFPGVCADQEWHVSGIIGLFPEFS